MRIPGRRIALLLAVPAVIGLAFATANSGVVYQADKGGGTCSSAKKVSSSCCPSTHKAGSSGCAAARSAGLCGSKASKSSGCGSATKAMRASANCPSGQPCNIEMVRGDGMLKVFVLGSKDKAHDWMTKVAGSLTEEHGLAAEVFDAKDGCWMEIRAGQNTEAFTKLLQASSTDKEGACSFLCGAIGCPPKA